MTKKLLRELVAEVRSHNVGSTYSAAHGWDKPESHGCDLCKSKWKPGKPERHKKKCLIARADNALGQKPRIAPQRPL